MAKLTKKADGTYAAPASSTMLDNITAGVQAPFLKEDEALDRSSARWAALGYGLLGLVVGSMGARYRASQGKEPIARIFL